MLSISSMILGIICILITCLVCVACIIMKEYLNKHDTNLNKFSDDEIKNEFLDRYNKGQIK